MKISEDLILEATRNVERGCNEALKQLGSFLQSHGKFLEDYGLPQPLTRNNEVEWELRQWSPQAQILAQQVDATLRTFNPEQREIFPCVQHFVSNNKPLFMFINGKAGCGKTYQANALCAWVQSIGRIALPTATSAFAAQLYPGGRTTHSTFGVSL